MLYEYFRSYINGDIFFKMIEFINLSNDRFPKTIGEERFEIFMNIWNSILIGIIVDRPPEYILIIFFYE